MNNLCLTNNVGWSFIYNGERSIQVKDKFGTDCGEAPFVCLNDLTSDEMEVLERSDEIERENLIIQFLQNRFATLGSETAEGGKKLTFHIQCYTYNSKPMVVFEKYGLQGGGRNKFLAFTAGVAKVAAGALVGVTVAASGGLAIPLACGGAGLASSGIGDMLYALRTVEEKITLEGYATQSTIGFAAGAAGGGVGLGVNFVAGQALSALTTTALLGATTSVASTTAGTVTEAIIKNDTQVLKSLTPTKLATTAVVGVLTGGISSLSKGIVETGGQAFLNSSSSLATKTMVAAAAGAAGNSAVKITENAISNYAFIKVMYEVPPNNNLIESGKLYVYTQQNEIVFQSVNAHGQLIITRIKEQNQFLLNYDQENSFEKLLTILKSKGQRNFSSPQQHFIYRSALVHQHAPVSLLNGVADAATVGATSGATVGFTQVVANQSQTTTPIPRKNTEQKERVPHFVKPIKTDTKEVPASSKVEVNKVDGESLSNGKIVTQVKQNMPSSTETANPKTTSSLVSKQVSVVTEKEMQESTSTLKRKHNESTFLASKTFVQVETGAKTGKKTGLLNLKGKEKPESSSKKSKIDSKVDDEETGKDNNQKQCELVPVTKVQIDVAQQTVNSASQKYSNLAALSKYSAVDIENKAKEIYNDSKNLKYYSSSEAIPYIEKKLSNEFGIPIGTLTDSLKVAYQNKADKYVPNPIISALTAKKNEGSALSLAKQDLDRALQTLQNLKNPKCGINPFAETPQPQTPHISNILELVTDSENYARQTGYANNLCVQMRYLVTRIVGTDHGNLFDQAYSVFLDASFKWEAYNGEGKYTQYGFLTALCDSLLNGSTTVPMEVESKTWYQSGLSTLGKVGVGAQTNGTNLQLGTMNTHNLVTVHSGEKTQGVEGFQLSQIPSSLSSVQHSKESNPTFGADTFSNSQPASLTLKPQAINGNGDTSTKNSTNLLQPSIQTSTALENAKNPLQKVEINPKVYAAADGVQAALKDLNKVSEGLGNYASSAVGKVTNIVSTLERIDDLDYQNESFVQKTACAVLGTAVEVTVPLPAVLLTAIPVVGPAASIAAAVALSEIASKKGDDAQKNCHEVINLFK